jgi:hypothetical protein
MRTTEARTHGTRISASESEDQHIRQRHCYRWLVDLCCFFLLRVGQKLVFCSSREKRRTVRNSIVDGGADAGPRVAGRIRVGIKVGGPRVRRTADSGTIKRKKHS